MIFKAELWTLCPPTYSPTDQSTELKLKNMYIYYIHFIDSTE